MKLARVLDIVCELTATMEYLDDCQDAESRPHRGVPVATGRPMVCERFAISNRESARCLLNLCVLVQPVRTVFVQYLQQSPRGLIALSWQSFLVNVV